MPFPYTFDWTFDDSNLVFLMRVRIGFASNPFAATTTWTDVTNDVIAFKTKRGRQHELDRIEAGIATLLLNNADGNYWPDNAGGSYYGNVKVGKKINIQASFDNGSTYNDLYTGYIEQWKPGFLTGGNLAPIMYLQCSDLIRILSRMVINSAGEAEELSGTRVGNILDAVSWPAGLRTIDAGQVTFQATGTLTNENAMTHLLKCAESELGLFYIDVSGNAAWEDRSHRTSSPHDAAVSIWGDDSGEDEYHDIDFALDDKLIFNEVRATRTGGSEQSASNSSSQTSYGLRSLVRAGLFHSADVPTRVYCNYLQARYAEPTMRIRNVNVLPQNNPVNLWPKVLCYDLSTRITMRLNRTSIDADYFIEGVEFKYDSRSHGGLFDAKWLLSDATRYLFTPDAEEDTLRPSGNGSSTEIEVQFPASTNHYDKVDEATTDNDTTYVEGDDATGGTHRIDTYATENAPYPNGTINNVTVHVRVRQTNDGATVDGKAKCVVLTGGTEYTGNAETLAGTSYAEYTKAWATNPDTAAAWTWAEIDAMEIGVSVYPPLTGGAADGAVRCTQVWVVVNYTPSW